MDLRREIGLRSAVLLTVGAMIGSGIFATPHDVALLITRTDATLALWAVGGLLALLGALSFTELGASIPETGGLYVYLRRAYGPTVAFTFAWAMMAVLVPSSVGFFAQIAARHVRVLLGWRGPGETALAIAIVAVIVAANLQGTRTATRLQDGATWIKTVGIVAVSAIAIVAASRWSGTIESPTPTTVGHAIRWSTWLAALVPVLWAYDGWIDITSVAGEVRDPQRNIPRALVLGTCAVVVVYLVANIGYLRGLGPSALAANDTPAAVLAERIGGRTGRSVLSVLVAVSTFGGCAVGLFSGSRVVFAVARAGDFLPAFAHASKTGVPDASVLSCGILAAVYVGSPVGRLGEIFVIGAWPFYALGAIGTIVLRRREPGLARPHRTVLYPWPIVLFALGSLAVVAGYAISRPRHTIFSAFVIACGLPVFAVARRRP